jgi:hypothetical protein
MTADSEFAGLVVSAPAECGALGLYPAGAPGVGATGPQPSRLRSGPTRATADDEAGNRDGYVTK